MINNMKKFIYILLSLLFSSLLYAQNNALVLNGAYTIMNGGTQTTPVYLVVNQNSTSGIVRPGGGHISSEQQYNYIKWVTGSNTGSYVFPFGVGGNAVEYIPFTFNKTTNTTSDVDMSTWATNQQNIPHAGPTNVGPVTNMIGVPDSVIAAVDRFWDIQTANGVTADLTFSYLGSENTTAFPTDTIKAQHWNGTSWDNQVGPGNLGVVAGVGTVGPILNQSTFSPWILTVTPNCPGAQFSYNSPFCEGDTVTPTAVIALNSAAGVFSEPTGGVVFIDTLTGEIDLQNSLPGTYTIYNYVDSTLSCPSALDSFQIVINPIMNSAINTSICQGDSIFVGGGWQTTAGSYYDTLSTVNGCDSILETILIINSLPSAPTLNDTTICIGNGIPALIAQGSGGTIYWYSDSLGTNLLDSGVTYTPLISSTGTYTYYAQESNGGCLGPLSQVTITVNGPTAVISTNPNPPAGTAPLTVNFTNNGVGGTTFNWDLGNGNSDTTNSTSNTYTNTGSYTVILTVSDGSCFAYDTVTVTVEGESWIIIPNVFTPNNDGVNDVFFVDSDNLESLNGEIWNRWGQLMFTWNTIKGFWDGRTSAGVECPEGTYYYIIKAKGNDGVEYNEKGSFTLLR
ncbi:MAG: hypothetical protein Kow0079_04500 [Vicingaceae bacterium]